MMYMETNKRETLSAYKSVYKIRDINVILYAAGLTMTLGGVYRRGRGQWGLSNDRLNVHSRCGRQVLLCLLRILTQDYGELTTVITDGGHTQGK